MNVSRRSFISYAACLPAACFTSNPLTKGAGARRYETGGTANCVLLDFSCRLNESFAGYLASLKAAGAPFELGWRDSVEHARLILLPATAMTDSNQARWLRNRVEEGAMALVESGGAFLSLREFSVQESLLRSQFGLQVVEAMDLWASPGRLNGPPYIDFTWPVAARIRDFSRIVPLDASTREAIALQGSQIVGLKRRLGAGTVVFLGSPVGPHLLAGDREARGWFESLLRQA
jgi:hypothetical protein